MRLHKTNSGNKEEQTKGKLPWLTSQLDLKRIRPPSLREAAAVRLDTAELRGFDAFVAEVRNTLRSWARERFDYLVNNAGNYREINFVNVTEADFDAVVNVHFKGVFFLTQKLLPLMNDGGRIVNISSGLTRFTVPGNSVYAPAKGAIEV